MGDIMCWQHWFKQLKHVSCFVLQSNIFSLVFNLIMNRVTNEQRLQIIEFYYRNACSVIVHREFSRPTEAAKFIPCFFHFMVSLIDPLKRLFRLMWLNFAPNLHCWTLKHQHTYVECELKQISQLYRPVEMMTINFRFAVVRSNWGSVKQQRDKCCGKI